MNVSWLVTGPTRNLTPADYKALAGNRVESWRWEVLDHDDTPMGTLVGVEPGATVHGSVFATIRTGGDLTWKGVDVPDWQSVRLRPWYSASFPDGSRVEYPMGVFLPASRGAQWHDGYATVQVDLYDKLLVLDEDTVDATYSAPAGAVVTARVRDLLLSAGEARMAVTDSAETLRSPMSWPAGTSKLKIVNDLLDAINYWSLWVDRYGQFRVEPYTPPGQRGVRREFVAGPGSLHLPAFKHEQDTFGIPNKVTVVGRSDGDEPPLIGVATNTDPASPSSYQARGGRWVGVTDEGSEATSQAVIDAEAARMLADLSDPSETFEVTHAPVDDDLNCVYRFAPSQGGVDALVVLQSWSWSTQLGALPKSIVRRVNG